MPPEHSQNTATESADLALAAAPYVPSVSSDPTGSTISLVRQMRVGGLQILTIVVWRQRIENHVEALDRHGWLMSVPARLAGWGRMAAILGPDALTDVLEEQWRSELERREKKRRRQEREEREAGEIWLLQEEVGRSERPAIVMRQGGPNGERFLTIKLDENWERDRIYDWAQWQSERYGEWKTHRDEHGEAALERLIMTEMLRTENAVRKAGLSSGGRRPLRFWRRDAM